MSRSNSEPRAMSLNDLRAQLAVSLTEWRDAGAPAAVVVAAIEDLHNGPTKVEKCVATGCENLVEISVRWFGSILCAECDLKFYPAGSVRSQGTIGALSMQNARQLGAEPAEILSGIHDFVRHKAS